MAHGLPSARAFASYGSRYARACSSSPSATSVSIASAQTGLRRVVQPAGEQSRRAARAGSRRPLEVAERELETAEHAEVQDGEELVRDRLRDGEAFLGRGARLLDEAQVRLERAPSTRPTYA